ncbi:MAG TPA: outer membrane protein transport protein, partial [Gemmataceae bacterium]|nr:outer membrane protein transport protein [Gemmataceae bacterium]
MVRRFVVWLLPTFSLLTAALLSGPAFGQTGYILNGQGPVNRSMGGASTAAPIDASGALYWNPASISGLPGSELEAGAELLYIRTKLSSSIPAGSLGFGFPPVGLSGSTNGDDGVFPLPNIGLVYKPEASDITYGFGTFLLGGFGNNYPGSTTNPILTPQPPGGLGVGPIFVQLQIMQMAPTVAVQLTDHLSIGVAPTLDMAQLQADP